MQHMIYAQHMPQPYTDILAAQCSQNKLKCVDGMMVWQTEPFGKLMSC